MRGQAMIDTLVLFLLVSTVLVTMYVYVGNRSREFQGLRYTSSFHQTGLLTMLGYYFELGVTRGRLRDILVTEACSGNFIFPNLSQEVKQRLLKINQNEYKNRHFIFYAESKRGSNSEVLVHAYDLYPTVCISDIQLATYRMKGKCENGVDYDIVVEYGTWPVWEHVNEHC